MQDNKNKRIIYIFGLIPVIWFALLVAPSINGGIIKILNDFSSINYFNIIVLTILILYGAKIVLKLFFYFVLFMLFLFY